MFVAVNEEKLIDDLVILARDIWREHYIPMLGEQQVVYMLDKYQSQKAIREQIEQQAFSYFLMIDQEEPVGYLGVQPRGEALFLSKIYVHSSCRGKGFGKAAVEFVTKLAQEKGHTKITLTVNKNNSGSITMYEKVGFKNIDSIVADIGNGFVRDAYVMEKQLSV